MIAPGDVRSYFAKSGHCVKVCCETGIPVQWIDGAWQLECPIDRDCEYEGLHCGKCTYSATTVVPDPELIAVLLCARCSLLTEGNTPSLKGIENANNAKTD